MIELKQRADGSIGSADAIKALAKKEDLAKTVVDSWREFF